MKFQFFRFYALVILAAALLVWSFNHIYTAVTQPSKSYQVDVESFFTGYEAINNPADTQQKLPLFEEVDANAIVLPEDIRLLLEQGNVIALESDNAETYYYRKEPSTNKLVKFGPFHNANKESSIAPYIIPLFYSSLACLLLLMMRPIFRDLQKLQADALAFGQKPQPMPRSVKESSNIYPLANAFYSMSNKILNFIQMNKDLSRTISHEIRTPLARMKFMLEIISAKIKPSQKERIQNDIAEIESLVNDYLSFAKVENETDTINRAEYPIKQFLEDIHDKFSIYEQDILIECHCDDVNVSFDKGSLSIAVQNLLTNALRFSKNTISLNFQLEGEACILSVEDDGPGVGENAAQLMQPFSRENTKEQNHKGFGLGLYIVRKVAIWHEGEFNISQSERLGGAKMQLRWPNQL